MDKTALEALKAANPIVEAARELGFEPVRNRIRCPRAQNHAHGDRTPSVTLSPDRGSFKCWVCPDVKGDVIDLVRIARDCEFTEAVAFLAQRSGIPLKATAPTSAPRTPPAKRPSVPAPRASEPDLLDAPAGPPDRRPALEALLELCSPVRGKSVAWLKGRRIFKKTWDGLGLRVVADYRGVSDGLRERFGVELLKAWGLFNDDGHLRFYRHTLLLPYFDAFPEGLRPVYLQARALEPEVTPKELSLSGAIPCPYNAPLLNGEAGRLYLCEGAIDTLSLLEAGFPAVGVPGASNFKPAWIERFRNKSVFVAFDADAAGEAGAVKVLSLLAKSGIDAHRLQIPAGKDINDWLRGGGLGIRL